MATSSLYMDGFDGFIPDQQGSRPRVQLPPEPARVSLPPAPTHWIAAPQQQYYTQPLMPNASTFDHSFPALGSTPPRINLPADGPHHPVYPFNMPQSHESTFEGKMRGMILNNTTPCAGNVTLPRDGSANPGMDLRSSKRPSQAQRKQQSGEIKGMVLQPGQPLPYSPGSAIPRQMQPQPAHGTVPTWSRRQGKAVSAAYNGQNRANVAYSPNQAYSRPPPQNRQLFNPSSNGPQTQRHQRYSTPASFTSLETQIDYLDGIANVAVEGAKISLEEFEEKQHLRLGLEQICRKAIRDFETRNCNNEVDVKLIELKCFGSLSTTFATKASDMDLVLVSPQSQPIPSSPDSELPRTVERALLDAGYGARLLTKTRIPIIRFCERPTDGLASLLLKEREKYEIETEASPKSPKSQVPPHKRKPSKPKSKKSTQKAEDSAVDAQKASDINKAPPESSSNSVNVAGLTDDEMTNKVTSPTKIEAQSDKNAETPVEESPDTLKSEASDPTLATKSDEERIRLYRLAFGEGWYEPSERRVIHSYIKIVGNPKSGNEEKSRAKETLRDLPNIIGRYRPPPEAGPLEFPKTGIGIQCDINFSNHLALHNSHLLRCYSLCDRRVRDMVLFVKAWSKKRKINTPYHGTLSSYGYVLMVLHYLVNIAQPPVLPNLQRMPQAFDDDVSAKVIELDGHNIQFFRNEDKIEELRNNRMLTSNTETVGSLLRGFYHYFAQQGYNSPAGGFSWTSDVLSLRTSGGLIPKKTKGWTGAKTETVELNAGATGGTQQTKDIRQRYLFAIEDPFETEHNIARTVVHNGIVAIRDELRRAHRLIEHAGMGKAGKEDLFEEAEDKENLQYRAFGPRPRKEYGPAKQKNGNGDGNADGNGGSGNHMSAVTNGPGETKEDIAAVRKLKASVEGSRAG